MPKRIYTEHYETTLDMGDCPCYLTFKEKRMGHYDEFEEDQKWLLHSNNREEELRQALEAWENLPNDELKKQTKGKPEGARNCFLTYLQQLPKEIDEKNFEHLQKLAELIELSDIDIRALREMYHCIEHSYGDNLKLWSEVIGVRNQALKSGKYKPQSYKDPIDITLLQDAMARHYIKYLMVSKLDEESGYSHLAHIVANILICIAQLEGRE